MNIFFTASLRGKEISYEFYKRIYDILSKDHTVFADHVFDLTNEEIKQWSPDYHFMYYQKILTKIRHTDLVVAEVSFNSINVGYEISLALEQKKFVIALYTGTDEPYIFKQIESDMLSEKVYIINYTNKDLEKQLLESLQYTKKNLMQRFTLLLPYKTINYLHTVSKKKRISKSHFVRSLIEEKMDKNS